jgi:hypothetical protein
MSEQQDHRFVVVDTDGQPDAAAADGGGRPADDGSADAGESIGEPAKVMRIGTMIKQLLEEVRAAPLDDASRVRLKEIHAASVRELEAGLTPELRIAQAQLVGWLEGVFHGLQAALVAQQLAARSQLEQMRRGALPPGAGAVPGPAGGGTGQYL